MNLNDLNKLALKDDNSCDLIEEEEEESSQETLAEHLSDALSLLEDTQEFLEVMIADSPKYITNYYLKQMKKLEEEISEFIADYVWNDGKEEHIGKNVVKDMEWED